MMLAMNMFGSLLKPAVLLAPPVTVMGAQFMYISGAPESLENHDQAKVAWPLGMESGRVKERDLSFSTVGQPPSKVLITLKTESLVGGRSVVMLSWQVPVRTC